MKRNSRVSGARLSTRRDEISAATPLSLTQPLRTEAAEIAFHPWRRQPVELKWNSIPSPQPRCRLNYYRPVISLKSWPSLIYRHSFRSSYYRLPSFRAARRRWVSTKGFCFHQFSAVFLNVVNVSRFASDSAFRVFLASNASRVLFNHDNGVLSTLELGCFNYLLQLFYVVVNSRS